jgi:hypothetical protein
VTTQILSQVFVFAVNNNIGVGGGDFLAMLLIKNKFWVHTATTCVPNTLTSWFNGGLHYAWTMTTWVYTKEKMAK